MNSASRFRRLLTAGSLLLAGGLLVLPALVGASSPNISHSYKADKDILAGSLVSLDAGPDKKVALANSNNAPKLVGIAVGANDSLVAIDASTALVQVATTGIANALVTTVNGDIKVGDQIAVSPFSGVA